ncbi:hypothetical protein IWQ56_000939 [Coemansia nantahalensis]|nr:hypothetical protein IWQ56_000939 [Coemansia nantahalensis]
MGVHGDSRSSPSLHLADSRSSVFSRVSKGAGVPISDAASAKGDFAADPADATGSSLRTFFNILGGGRIANYHDIGFEAFGKLGYYTISVFNIVNIIGTTGIYVILASNNTAVLLAQVGVHINARILMIACTAVMCVPTLFSKTFADTLLVSLIGTMTSVIVTVVVVVMACMFPIRDGDMHVGNSTVHVGATAHYAVLPGGFSMALSSVTFAYVGSTIVPHLEASMRRPEKFNAVFGSALVVIAAVYMVTAATGYWAYGDRTLSPITQNFPKSKWDTAVGCPTGSHPSAVC